MAYVFQVDSGGTLLTNLISGWPLLANANDYIGSNNLTNNGSVTFSGSGGSFNGSSQWLSIASPTGLLPTSNTARSISFWTNSTSLSGFPTPFGYGNNTTTGQQVVYELDSATPVLDVGGGSAASFSATVNTSTLYNWIITYPGTGTTFTVYQNGSSVGTPNPGSTINTITGSGLAIGRREATAGQYFSGTIRDVYYWTKVLSSTERSEIYNSGTPNTLVAAATGNNMFMGANF